MIRHGVYGRKGEEAAVEEVTFEHEFHFGVGVSVDLLDDEDFDHHDRVIGFTADVSGVKGAEDFFESFPIDELVDFTLLISKTDYFICSIPKTLCLARCCSLFFAHNVVGHLPPRSAADWRSSASYC